MQNNFKIGDKVEIINGDKFNYTKTGSQGTIMNIYKDNIASYAMITFSKFTGIKPHTSEGNSFEIELNHLKLMERKINQYGIVVFCKTYYK